MHASGGGGGRLHMHELCSLSLVWSHIPKGSCVPFPMPADILQAAPHLCKKALYGQPSLGTHMSTHRGHNTAARLLTRGRLDDMTLQLLKPLKMLTELAFVACECVDIPGLSQLSQLQKLSLDDCNNTNATQVAEAVARLPSLHCLSLQRNALDTPDSSWLVQLAAMTQLTRVVLLQSVDLDWYLTLFLLRMPGHASKFVW
jgi:hypothetical protein